MQKPVKKISGRQKYGNRALSYAFGLEGRAQHYLCRTWAADWQGSASARHAVNDTVLPEIHAKLGSAGSTSKTGA